YRSYHLVPTARTLARKILFATPARVKKVFYPMPDRIVPGYYLELDLSSATSTSADLWGYVIAADTGELLLRRHLTFSVAYNYKVWGEAAAPYTPLDGPIGDFTPHPTGLPDGSAPPFIPPVMLSIDGFNQNPNNTFDPWLPAGA